jgi:threonylcarbamoyladenosine tRNA methylthiotransferase MtaB
MQVCFSNLGCKLNQAELEHLARDFSHAGYRVTRDLAAADLHVVNTCTVTHVAARDSRKIARRGKRLNPEIRTVLTGCYAAEDERQAREATGADLIVPNHEKERLLDVVRDAFPDLVHGAPAGSQHAESPYARIDFGNSRALVKIEDGCNTHCAFCIIPTTRGRQRSRPPVEIASEVRELTGAGFPEIVLTGVQISSYRWQGSGLIDLTTRLLSETAVRRLRLTSIAPWQFDHRLLDLFDSGRLCRHVHLSLQSGSTTVLERMRRPYTAGEFANLVAVLKKRVPGIAITTDVIAGLPGESEAEFQEGLAFVREMAFSRVHVFPYSIRFGTEAADLPGQVAPRVKGERVQRLLSVAAQSEKAFVSSQIGSQAEVLWEVESQGTWRGTSDNYVRVRTRSASNLARKLTRSVLTRRRGNAALTTLPDAATDGAGHAT